jgi:hypothetical protein
VGHYRRARSRGYDRRARGVQPGLGQGRGNVRPSRGSMVRRREHLFRVDKWGGCRARSDLGIQAARALQGQTAAPVRVTQPGPVGLPRQHLCLAVRGLAPLRGRGWSTVHAGHNRQGADLRFRAKRSERQRVRGKHVQPRWGNAVREHSVSGHHLRHHRSLGARKTVAGLAMTSSDRGGKHGAPAPCPAMERSRQWSDPVCQKS